MSDDNAGTPDRSRNEREKQNDGDVRRIEETDGPQHPGPADGGCDDELQVVNAKIAEKIIDSIPSEAMQDAVQLVAAESHSVQHWAGLLPDPDSFSKYPEEVQRAMVAWNDAQIIDASKRLDRFADAAVSSIERDSVLTFSLNLVFAILSFIAFIVTGSVWSYGLLAIPGVSIAVNVIGDRRKKSISEDEGIAE